MGGLSLVRVAVAAFALSSLALGFQYRPRLINGTVVDPAQHPQVIKIKVEGAGCTATVVGPKVFITAAHCGRTNSTAEFTLNGQSYTATLTRSPVYPGQENDIAIGVTNQPMTGVKPITIWTQTPTTGTTITLFGYGCTTAGGGDVPDGKLRKGTNHIKDVKELYFSSNDAGGAALCFGDSGGPAFVDEGGNLKIIGVNSKGNLNDLNYDARLDVPVSKQFLNQMATEKGVEICGINGSSATCGGGPTDPAPTCNLTASPQTIKLGGSLTLNLTVQNNPTAVTLDGVTITPPGGTSKTITPSTTGTFTSVATVSNATGSNSCSTSYTVTNDPVPTVPTCTLTASPSSVKLGQSVTLNLAVQGNPTSVSIDGQMVNPPGSTSKFVTPTSVGNFNSVAVVSNNAGSNSCSTTYSVTNDPIPTVPTCTIVVNPHFVKLGGSVVATMTVQGTATSASIDGKPISPTGGSMSITPTVEGWHAATGTVSGGGGTNTCRDSYTVEGNDPPPPPGGTFTLVPLYCGMNIITENPISEVCVTLVQYKVSTRAISVKEGLLISFTSGTQEFLPIVMRRQTTPAPGDIQVTEELGLYANKIVRNGTNLSMYVKKGKIVTLPGQEVPKSVEGYTSDGKLFMVNTLKKM